MNRIRLFVLLVPLLLASFASALEVQQPALKPDGKERQGPGYAFICLQANEEPGLPALRKSLATWLSVPAEEVSEGQRSSKDGKALTLFQAKDKVITIILANFAIPEKDIEAAIDNSFMWPDARKAVAGHKSHLIVAVQGKFENPGAEGLFLSRAIAACTETYKAAGVYWGHGALLTDPPVFRESMQKASDEVDKLPVFLWLSFLRGKSKDGIDVYTKGLSAFGVMECEVVGSKQRPSDILDLLAGMGAYLIANGNVVKDGDTVGGDEKQQIKAHHADSAIGRKEKVLRIDY